MIMYKWYQWLAFFYIYCFVGWCIESTYVSIKKKKWVNRGFLRLPMLPIYGSGAVIMLFASVPFRDNLLMVYLSGMAAATILEYITGSVMEKLFKVRYWDYTGNRFQLNGHICLGTSLCWGLLSVALTEFLHNPVETAVLNINKTFLFIPLAVISILFIADSIKSVQEALDIGKALERITALRKEWEDMQKQLERVKEYAKQQMEELQENTEQKLEVWKETASDQIETVKERLEKQKEAIIENLNILKEDLEQTKGRLDLKKIRLLKRNPSAASHRFAKALKELKERSDKKHKPG